MSTTRAIPRAKTTQTVSSVPKKAVSGAVVPVALTDSTNTLHSIAPKKTGGLQNARSSIIPNNTVTPITPKIGTSTSNSRVSAALKHSDTSSKVSNAQAKPVDMWAPLPTPVPMSSSRSFSELMKSEENLSSRVAQLQAIVEQQQHALSVKDSELRSLRSEVANGQEMVAKTHRSWESKSEALLAQQQEKYQDLNDRYLLLLSRARACESKLEELLIDPLTLQPFQTKIADQTQAETALQQQRTILSIVEEHQHKEDIHILELQRDTEAMLRSAVEELAPTVVTDLIAAARNRCSNLTESQLRQVELSIPSLIIEQKSHLQEQNEDDTSAAGDLDWSIMTSDEPLPSHLESTEQITIGNAFPPLLRATEESYNPGLDDSTLDDDFFNESVTEDV